jgi:hypothetical protein
MKATLSSDRHVLTITVDEQEREELLRWQDDHAGMENENICSDVAMCDFFERLTCNSEYEWVNPEDAHKQFGDLTDAPMLGIFGVSDETRSNGGVVITERWAFVSYEVVSVLEQLRDRGYALFIN